MLFSLSVYPKTISPIIMERKRSYMKEILYTHFPQGSLHDMEESQKSQMELVTSLGGRNAIKNIRWPEPLEWFGWTGPSFGESCPFLTVGYNKRHRDFEEDTWWLSFCHRYLHIKYVYCNTDYLRRHDFRTSPGKNTILRWTYQGLSSLYMMGLFNQAPETTMGPPKTYAF